MPKSLEDMRLVVQGIANAYEAAYGRSISLKELEARLQERLKSDMIKFIDQRIGAIVPEDVQTAIDATKEEKPKPAPKVEAPRGPAIRQPKKKAAAKKKKKVSKKRTVQNA